MKMRKSKIFIFFFMWLLLIAAPSVYAEEVNGIVAKDAWDFAKTALTPEEYQSFKEIYGETKEDFEKNKRAEFEQKRSEANKNVNKARRNAGMSRDNSLEEKVSKLKEEQGKYEEITCFGGQDGDTYCLDVGKNNVSVSSKMAEGNGCGIVEVHWYNHRRCLFCPFIGKIYNVVDKVTVVSYNYLGRSFAILAAVILLLWLAIKTLVFVSSMSKQDAAKYITECIQQIYKFLIAFLALIYYNNIFRYILLPLLGAALNFGTMIVGGGSLSDRLGEDVAAQVSSNDVKALADASDSLPKAYENNLDNTYFKLSTLANLENLVYNINSNYSLIQTIGSRLMCLSGRLVLKVKIGLATACFINGMVFYISGLLLGIAFAFYLLDSVIQLGMVGALLPFMVASWPFKKTSKYTTNGFKMYLNSLFTFMLAAVICKVSVELINQAAGANSTGTISPNEGFKELVEAINTFQIDKLEKKVNVLSMGFIVIIFACLTSFLLMQKVGEIVGKFASGGLKPAAPEIGGMAASAVKGAAKKVAAPTTKAIKGKAKDAVAATPGAIKNTIKAVGRKLGIGKKNKDNNGSSGGEGSAGQNRNNRYETSGNNGQSQGGNRYDGDRSSNPDYLS